MRKHRGDFIYVDFLFLLTHQYYPKETAKLIWKQIIIHKNFLSIKVGRNIGITVATLDLLMNVPDKIKSPTVISEHKISKIAEIAIKDGLTDVYDVFTFRAKLETEIKRYQRYASEASVLMIDIDEFKQLNDLLGHQEGDRLLAEVATLIKKTTRDFDICSRYGGEEFAVILPQTGLKAAIEIAERIRRRIELKFEGSDMTVSIGCAVCPDDGKTVTELIKKSDKALYYSKRGGKNQVTEYQDIETEQTVI